MELKGGQLTVKLMLYDVIGNPPPPRPQWINIIMDFRSFLFLFACQDFLGEFGPPIISKTMLRACRILRYRRVYII